MAEAQAHEPPRVRIDPATVKAEQGKRGYVVSAVGLDGTHYLYDGPVLDRREARGLRAMLRERGEIQADPQHWYAEPAARAPAPQQSAEPAVQSRAAPQPAPALAVHLAIGPQPAPSVARAPAGLQAEVSAQRAAQVLDVFRAYENQVRNFSDAQRHARDLARAGVIHAPQAAARLAANRWGDRIEETATRAAGLGVPRHLLDQYTADRAPGFPTKEAARRAALASVGVSMTLDAGPTPERPLGRASAAQLASVYLASIARRAEASRKYHMNSPEAKRLADTRHFTAQREAQAVTDELRARLGLNRPTYRVEAQPFAGQRAPALSPERQRQRQQEAQAAVQAIRQRGAQVAAPAVAAAAQQPAQQSAAEPAAPRLSPLAARLVDVERVAPESAAPAVKARGPDREAMIQGWGRHNRPPESARPYEIPARSAPAAEPQRITQISPSVESARSFARYMGPAAEMALQPPYAEPERQAALRERSAEAGRQALDSISAVAKPQEGRADPAPKQPEQVSAAPAAYRAWDSAPTKAAAQPAGARPAPITPEQKDAAEKFRQAMVSAAERAEVGRWPHNRKPRQPEQQPQPGTGRAILAKHGALAREVALQWLKAPGNPIAHDKVKQAVNADRDAARAARGASR